MERPRIPDPGTLEGNVVRLEPLTMEHCEALVKAQAESRETFDFTFVPSNLDEAQQYVATAVALRDNNEAFPFATVDRRSGRVVGTTRFANLHRYAWPSDSPFDRGPQFPDDAEIGWTWLAHSAQRTAINTEAKLLMLTWAFETWRVHVVRLCTDARNIRSRNAILRLGAKFDGIIRADRPASSDAILRDTAWFSIVEREWPGVKLGLQRRL